MDVPEFVSWPITEWAIKCDNCKRKILMYGGNLNPRKSITVIGICRACKMQYQIEYTLTNVEKRYIKEL